MNVGGRQIKYLGDDDFLIQRTLDTNVVVCVGEPDLRAKIVNKLKVNPNLHFPNVILGHTQICQDVSMGEIEAAIQVLEQAGTTDITVLHCNTEYPTPFCDVNLLAMKQMAYVLKKPIGYSDHTVGIEVPIAAVALGAVVIEKHFTLDRTMEGPDHKASLEPDELKAMVSAIRNIEKSLGDGEKKRTESEAKNCAVARKSIVAKRKIQKGETFTEENLTVKRPGTGISPMKWYEVLGTKAEHDYEADELI